MTEVEHQNSNTHKTGMSKNRLEAFSDGVLAIIITIMVLELKIPHGDSIDNLQPLIPVFLSYALSFVYVGIYWNNHHHLLQIVKRISGSTLWANMHLLFWLSLIPFATAWSGENHFSMWPVVTYGFVLLCSAVAYYILVRSLLATHEENSDLARAIGGDFKGKVSVVIYIIAMLSAFLSTYIAIGLYVLVAIIWFVPDSRIEKIIKAKN